MINLERIGLKLDNKLDLSQAEIDFLAANYPVVYEGKQVGYGIPAGKNGLFSTVITDETLIKLIEKASILPVSCGFRMQS